MELRMFQLLQIRAKTLILAKFKNKIKIFSTRNHFCWKLAAAKQRQRHCAVLGAKYASTGLTSSIV